MEINHPDIKKTCSYKKDTNMFKLDFNNQDYKVKNYKRSLLQQVLSDKEFEEESFVKNFDSIFDQIKIKSK